MTEPGYRDSARPPKVYCRDCIFYRHRDQIIPNRVQGDNPVHVCDRDVRDVAEHPVQGLMVVYIDASEKNKNMDCRDYLAFPRPETRREKSFLDPFGWALVSMLIFLITYCLLEAFL